MTSSKLPLFHQLTNLSNNHHNKPPPTLYPYLHLRIPPSLPTLSATSHNRCRHSTAVNCRTSGGDEFLSTNSFYREFSVIANMLKKIELLDTSVISNGVSDSVINAMKQMISAMLGLLPLEELSVTVTVTKRHLVRLLASSVITGYTLWKADYRIRLLSNFEKVSVDMPNKLNSTDCDDALKVRSDDENYEMCDDSVEIECCSEELERLKLKSCLDDLSNDAMIYIHELESELSNATKELHTQKQETTRIGYARESSDDLLKYLRSLDSDMMNELSRPSSPEVKEVLQQLVHYTSRRVFKEDITSRSMGDLEARVQENNQNSNVIFCETRDYLGKLLFWCMLLGHQLRSLENRLYLSCAVGF